MIIEIILINIIYILFPIFCYLIYVTYQKTKGSRVNVLFFDLSLLSGIYLVSKYGILNNIFNIMLLNIILIVAFCKRRYLLSVLLSIYLIYHYNYIHQFNFILLVFQYFTFILLFIIFRKNKTNNYIIVIFNIINFTFNLIYLIFIDNKIQYINILFYSLVFAVISYLIVNLIENAENIIELNSTIKRLEKEKSLRNSLFKITHEIKNPIAVCKGYLDMIDTNNKIQVNKYIPIIKQEINRTLTLMNDFLSLTKLKINKSPLDIILLIEDTCYSLETLFEINNIEFDYIIPSNEVYIEGDYDRLKQVLVNVIKNSIEAIESKKDGKVKMVVKIEKTNLIIKIEDNGIGMKEDVLKRVGESFFTTKEKGTGLGIKLSNEIIGAHNGSINYKSEIDVGTAAIIKLPIKVSA